MPMEEFSEEYVGRLPFNMVQRFNSGDVLVNRTVYTSLLVLCLAMVKEPLDP